MERSAVDVLVLGAGWTSQFLVPYFIEQKVSYALTTTTGEINKACAGKYSNSKIIPFVFQPDPDPDSGEDPTYDAIIDEKQYSNLPEAKTIIIVFKLEGRGQAKKLVDTYQKTHTILSNFIQLGSTGIYKEPTLHNHESPYDQTSRAVAEDELRELGGLVLNLAGLWGAERVPWNWVDKVASTKEKLRAKQALHLIHGLDVARACMALHKKFYAGERYLLTDGRVYDWWLLVDWWAEDLERTPGKDGVKHEYRRWLIEIMEEGGVSQLPRSNEVLGRVLDSSDFWRDLKLQPRILLTQDTKSNL